MHAVGGSSRSQVHAGGKVLTLIAEPLSIPILRAHLDGPLQLPDLHECIARASRVTLRGQVGNLRGIGALERHVRGGMPYAVENDLTNAGREILEVAGRVEAWLARAPQGAIPLGTEPAKGAIRSLVGGWGSTVLRALAVGPLSLAELDSLITDLSYPSLERRLSAMRAVRQVEPRPKESRGATPFAVTKWTRQAVAPLVAAGRCECRHMPKTIEAPTQIDIEAAFLLAIPLVDLQANRDGSCLLAVDVGTAKGEEAQSKDRIVGVHVEVEDGMITSCVSRHEWDSHSWVLGSAESWVDAILEGRFNRLWIGGENVGLAKAMVEGLNTALRQRPPCQGLNFGTS